MWDEGGGREGRGGDESRDGLRPMEAKGSDIYINEGVGGVRKQKGECAADKESRAERGGGETGWNTICPKHSLVGTDRCHGEKSNYMPSVTYVYGYQMHVFLTYRNCPFLA